LFDIVVSLVADLLLPAAAVGGDTDQIRFEREGF
jgi:hypothetical protein